LEEYQTIAHLNFPVVGVNNRDLATFKTSLNCCNYIARNMGRQGLLVAESGMANALHLRIASQHAQGFLIGTSLMRMANLNFGHAFQKGYFLKACGIRTPELLQAQTADLIGINFSPISKRRGEEGWLNKEQVPANAVAVFKNNTEEDVLQVIAKHSFQYVQLYADDFGPAFVKNIKQRVILAISVKSEADLALAEAYAPYIDCFILDGAQPGSGQGIQMAIPADFPYPFFLAGGMNAQNAHLAKNYTNCIGIDTASGIETEGKVDAEKIKAIKMALQ
jgi:phosphoribosylanthranilate isomerase